MAVTAIVSLAVGYAVYKAATVSIPKVPTAAEQETRVKNVLSSEYNVPVVYGEQRVDGNIVFYNTTGTNNKYLDIVVVIAEGEIDGITKVFMDDGALPLFDGSGSTLTDSSSSETEVIASSPIYGTIRASGVIKNADFADIWNSDAIFEINGIEFPATGSITTLVNNLNASTDPGVSNATYSDAGNSKLQVVYDVGGPVGNNFTVTRSYYSVGFIKSDTMTLSGGRDTPYVTGYFYNGVESQPANSVLTTAYPPSATSDGWTSAHKLDGFAYAYIRLLHNPDIFSGGIPKFSFEIKGRKVYDSRYDSTNGGSGAQRLADITSWEYSANPAICLNDYVTNARFGKGLDSADINLASLVAAADDCDTLKNGLDVDSAPITYKTYEIGAVVDTAKPVKDNLAYFLQAMNGTLPFYDGTYYFKILQAGSSSVSFTKDNIVGKIALASSNKKTRFNKTSISFMDKQRHYKSGDAVVDPLTIGSSSSSAVAAGYYADDNNQLLEKRVEAPYVNYYPRARDLAELTMNLSRRGLSINITTTMEALKAVAGDIADITYDTFGWVNKEFRIEGITSRLDGLCDVSLSEHDDSLYTLTEQQEQPTPNESTLSSVNEVVKPIITSISCDKDTVYTTSDGLVHPRIFVTWENQDDYPVEHYVYLKKTSESTFVKVGQVTKDDTLAFYIPNVDWNVSYDVGVATVNGIGLVSVPAVNGLTVPDPLSMAVYNYPDVTGLELIGSGTELGLGNGTEFTGQDIRIQWRLSTNFATVEFGSNESELIGGAGGTVPFTLKGYRVEVYHVGDTEPRQDYFVTDPNFTYSYDKNFDDGSGDPSRTVTFKVVAVGTIATVGLAGESEIPATITVENPQPALPTGVSVTGGFQHIDLLFNKPNDNDYKGTKVWVSESTGFTPSDTTLVYDGPDSKIQITGLATGTEYFLVFAPYDGFGVAGINYSSEYSVTTQAIISADLDNTPPTDPTSLVLSSTVQDSKLYVKSSIKATWVASTDDGVLSGYVLQYWDDVDSTKVEAFTTSLEYVITDAVVGRTYSVRVKAVDWASNESGWTATGTQVAAGDTASVANVTGLTATAGLKKVILDWTNPTSAGYLTTNVYRGTATGVYDPTPIYVGLGDTFVDSDVSTGTEYFYVLSTNSVSQVESSQTAEVSATPTTITAANATEYIAAAAIDADRIVANSITANEIASNTITGTEITGTTLSGIFVDAGTLTAGTINGLTIQTSATATTTGGATMTPTGFKGYNTSGVQTSGINTDGSGFLGLTNPIQWTSAGVVTVPGTLISGEIIGNTFKTGTTGYRVEMSSSAPFTYWNGTTTLASMDISGNLSISGDILIDSNNYWKKSDNTFQVGDGTSNMVWDGIDLITRTLKTSTGSGKRIELNPAGDNELHFYGDRGDTTVEELASIGRKTVGSDNFVLSIGSGNNTVIPMIARSKGVYSIRATTSATTSSGSGIFADSLGVGSGPNAGLAGQAINSTTTNRGVVGIAQSTSVTTSADYQGVRGGVDNLDSVSHTKVVGVYGYVNGGAGYGGQFTNPSTNGGAPLLITPSASASAPTHTASIGAMWVTSAGVLYINTSGSTTWTKVGAQ